MIPPTRGEATTEGDADAEAQLDVLYEHLDDARLSPVLDEPALRFEMLPCCYRGMSAQNQATVCGMHARLVRDRSPGYRPGPGQRTFSARAPISSVIRARTASSERIRERMRLLRVRPIAAILRPAGT